MKKTIKPELAASNGQLLAQLNEICNSLDAVVYVADMETYEILFANTTLERELGSVKGKPCWETIYPGQTGPCEFCTNKYLLDEQGQPAGVYAWELQNPQTRKWFDIRDQAIHWPDGRLVRLEIATDITKRVQAEQDLACYASILKAITQAAEGFVQPVDFELALHSALGALGEATKVASIVLFENILLDDDTLEMSRRLAWRNEALTGRNDSIDQLRLSYARVAPHWQEILGNGKILQIQSNKLTEMQRQVLEGHEVVSSVLVPVFVDGHWWGFMAYSNHQHVRVWTREEQNALHTAAGAIGAALSRQQAEEERYLAASVFQNSLEGIMITNLDGRILRVNPAFSRITGYQAEEVAGKTPALLRSGRHSETFYARIWQALDTEGIWQGEIWNRRKSGEIYPQWLAISRSEPNHKHKGHYIGVFNDITQQKASEERIQHLALYDPLTDLPNRRLFKEHLEQAIREAKRNNHWVALLYIDLDRFKNINDSLGHTAGDNLLKVIAERLSFVVRTSDLVARLGGDEFVVILSGLPADRSSVARIEKLTMQLQQAITQPCFLDPEQVFVSASIGVSLYPRDSNEINALISNADTAMYHAKQQGRNNAQFFSSQMNLEATRRLVMQGHLRDALERQEFELYFQPQFPIDSEQLIGFEALVRWHHPDGHLSLPLEFITLAEETGQILPIGEWILGNAFEQMVEWYAQGFENLKLSVNISSHQLRSPGFIQAFETMLNTSGVPVMCLQLEIKEGSLVGQFDHELEALQRIRDMGVSLVLDDFCTGNCSLGHLTRLSVDAVKIHKSFIDQMAGNQNTSMLVKAIVTMANGLGLQTVAEGVERPEQIDRLRDIGCAAVQGNLTGRSMPVDEAGGLLRARGVASAKSSIN